MGQNCTLLLRLYTKGYQHPKHPKQYSYLTQEVASLVQVEHRSALDPHSKRPDARVDDDPLRLELPQPALELEQRDLPLDGELALVQALLAGLRSFLVHGVQEDAGEAGGDGHGLRGQVRARREDGAGLGRLLLHLPHRRLLGRLAAAAAADEAGGELDRVGLVLRAELLHEDRRPPAVGLLVDVRHQGPDGVGPGPVDEEDEVSLPLCVGFVSWVDVGNRGQSLIFAMRDDFLAFDVGTR